jgi:hypothetical protein
MKQVFYALNEQVAEKFGPFKTKDEAQKAIVEEVKKGSPVFGWELEEKEVKSWKDIKTFDDACEALGENNKLVEAYHHTIGGVSDGDEEDFKELVGVDMVAYLKLRIITAAINEGWEPKFTEDECRWFPWFYLYTEDEYRNFSEERKRRCVGRAVVNANAGSGLVFACASSASTFSVTHCGARLAFESEEKTQYAGVTFKELWADFCWPEK